MVKSGYLGVCVQEGGEEVEFFSKKGLCLFVCLSVGV